MPRFDVQRGKESVSGGSPGKQFSTTLTNDDVTKVTRAANNLVQQGSKAGQTLLQGNLDRAAQLKELERKNNVGEMTADMEKTHFDLMQEMETYTGASAGNTNGEGLSVDGLYGEKFEGLKSRWEEDWKFMDDKSKFDLNNNMRILEQSGRHNTVAHRVKQLKIHSKAVNLQTVATIASVALNAGQKLSPTLTVSSDKEIEEAAKNNEILPFKSGFDQVMRRFNKYKADQLDEVATNIISVDDYNNRIQNASNSIFTSYIQGRMDTSNITPEEGLQNAELLKKQFDDGAFDAFISDNPATRASEIKQLGDRIEQKRAGLKKDISQQGIKEEKARKKAYQDTGLDVWNQVGRSAYEGELTHDQVDLLPIDEVTHDNIPGKKTLRTMIDAAHKKDAELFKSDEATLGNLKVNITTNPESLTPSDILAFIDNGEESLTPVDAEKLIAEWQKDIKGERSKWGGKFKFLAEEYKLAKKFEDNSIIQFDGDVDPETREEIHTRYNQVVDELLTEIEKDPEADVDKVFDRVMEPYRKQESENWIFKGIKYFSQHVIETAANRTLPNEDDDLRQQIVDKYQKDLKRDPTDRELEIAMRQIKSDADLPVQNRKPQFP